MYIIQLVYCKTSTYLDFLYYNKLIFVIVNLYLFSKPKCVIGATTNSEYNFLGI